MTEDLDAALEKLDRQASLGMATGSRITIDPMDLRKIVKSVRGLSSAKAAYHQALKRCEIAELLMYRWGIIMVLLWLSFLHFSGWT